MRANVGQVQKARRGWDSDRGFCLLPPPHHGCVDAGRDKACLECGVIQMPMPEAPGWPRMSVQALGRVWREGAGKKPLAPVVAGTKGQHRMLAGLQVCAGAADKRRKDLPSPYV